MAEPQSSPNLRSGAFIYINGYPAVGKHTAAIKLAKLIPKSRVFQHNLIHIPVCAIRDKFGLQDLKRTLPKAIRDPCLAAIGDAIVDDPEFHGTTWIFTDRTYDNARGHVEAAMKYAATAIEIGYPFYSIVLHCDEGENLRRANRMSAKWKTGKRLKLIHGIPSKRTWYELHTFGESVYCDGELQIDTTGLTASEVAKKIHDFVVNAEAQASLRRVRENTVKLLELIGKGPEARDARIKVLLEYQKEVASPVY